MRTSSVEIRTPEGTMPAHLAEPEGRGPFPALVVIMEAFGLVPHIRNVAERLAGEGYVALAPDFYWRWLPDNAVGYDRLDRAVALMQKVDDARFTEDMGAALDFLAARPEVDGARIGVRRASRSWARPSTARSTPARSMASSARSAPRTTPRPRPTRGGSSRASSRGI